MIFANTKAGDKVVVQCIMRGIRCAPAVVIVKKVDRDYVHIQGGGLYSRRTGRTCGPCGGGARLNVEQWIEPHTDGQ